MPIPSRKAIEARSASRINPEFYTMGEAFKDGGYTTAHIGKWHIGEEPSDPLSQGFDVDIPHSNAPSPLPNGWFAPWPVWKDEGKEGDHLEDRMAEEAVKFIKENNPKKTGKPFLLNYWAFSVHSPWKAKQTKIDKYEKKANYYEAQHSAVYAAMVETMDEAVGQLIKALKNEGLMDNTIVIFYSDNGGWYLSAKKFVHPDYIDTPLGSNYPLRDGKASIYEGGTRVPLAISWPKNIKAGTVNHQAIVSSVDIYPTLLDLCGIEPKETVPFDGISIAPALKGDTIERDEIYCHFPHYTRGVPSTYVRKGNWKLIKHYHDNDDQSHRYELYDIHKDIAETINLATSNPDKVKELNTLIEEHLAETDGVVPIANPNWKAHEGGVKGLEGGGTATLKKQDGVALLESSGKDPYLRATTIHKENSLSGGPFKVSFGMKSNSKGSGQLFYQQPFNSKQSVDFTVKHDGVMHDVVVDVPARSMSGLRIDPGTAAGRIEFTYITIKDAKGKVVKEWRFK